MTDLLFVGSSCELRQVLKMQENDVALTFAFLAFLEASLMARLSSFLFFLCFWYLDAIYTNRS